MQEIIELRRYCTIDGREPFTDWLNDMDHMTACRIQAHVHRMKSANLGNSRPVGQGVSELKIDFGPGYRVYYIRSGFQIVILLCGGDKSSQQADIRRAQDYAADYWRKA